jgi:hypothetical protein
MSATHHIPYFHRCSSLSVLFKMIMIYLMQLISVIKVMGAILTLSKYQGT